jgi:hypothetical protein
VKDILNISPGDLLLYGSPTIRIIDIRGVEVMRKAYSEQVDISSLPDGIYFISLNINGKQLVYNRFIKTR